MKKIIVVLFILLGQFGFGQNQDKIDSLKTVIASSIEEEIEVLNNLSVLSQTINIDSALFYNKKAIMLAKHKLFKNKLPKLYTTSGVNYWYKGQLDSAEYFFKESIKSDVNMKDSLLWAKNNCNIAILLDNKGLLNDAITYYNKGLSIFNKLQDSTNIYKSLSNIAILLSDIKNFEKALEKNTQALLIAEKLNDPAYKKDVD